MLLSVLCAKVSAIYVESLYTSLSCESLYAESKSQFSFDLE